MDRQEYREIVTEIKRSFSAGNFERVVMYANDLEPEKVKDNSVLELISEAYENLGKYELAREILLIAYERSQGGRKMAYKLSLLSVQLKDLDNAVEFYEDFCKMAPHDNDKYLLKYIIGKAGGIPVKDLIKVLETYVSNEMDDRWQYELARLYHEAGFDEQCVEVCDEIVLWFSDGEYVKRALELKSMLTALTASQQEKYDILTGRAAMAEPVMEEEPLPEAAPVMAAVPVAAPEESYEPAEELAEDYLRDLPEEEPAVQHEDELFFTIDYEDEKPAEPAAPKPVDAATLDRLKFEEKYDPVEGRVITQVIPKEQIEKAIEELSAEGAPTTFIGITETAAERDMAEAPAEVMAETVEETGEAAEETGEAAEETGETFQWEGMDECELSEAMAGKLGYGIAGIAAAASGVFKPDLRAPKKAAVVIPEVKEEHSPKLSDNVDLSFIPMYSDDDGQVNLNLELMKGEEEMEGQMSLEELYAEYMVRVENNPEKVAQVEAARLRAVQKEVDRITATPLIYSTETIRDYEPEEEYEEEYEEDYEEDLPGQSTFVIPVAAPLAAEAEEAESEEEDEYMAVTGAGPHVGDTVVFRKPVIEEAEEPEAEAEEEPEAAPEEEVGEEPEAAPEENQNENVAETIVFSAASIAAALEAEKAAEEETVEEVAEAEAEEPEEAVESVEDTAVIPAVVVEEAEEAGEEPEAAPEEEAGEAEEVTEETEAAEAEEVPEEAEAEETGEVIEEPEAEGETEEPAEEEYYEETEEYSEDDEYAEYDNEEPYEDDSEYAEEFPENEIYEGDYELPEDIKEELAEFMLIDGMEEDVRSTLGSMIDRCNTGDRTGGNLIITGDQKSGKTYMTISLIKAVSREMGEGAGKVAKVKAEALNGKDFTKVFGRIGDSHLVIENVGNMNDSTLMDMMDAMRNGGNKGMVVLEGNKLAIANIAAKFPEIWELFLNRLNIEELSISKWAEIGCKYAVEQGYDLDDLAVLALHARIDEIKIPTERLGYEDIMNLVEDAMEKADKRHKGRLFGSKKNGGRKILTEADFL